MLSVGLQAFERRTALFGLGFDQHRPEILRAHELCCAGAAACAWLKVFGLIGLFPHVCSRERAGIRYCRLPAALPGSTSY